MSNERRQAKPHPRWLPRFGLRSLLVLVTVLAIGLAYVGNEWHRLGRQRQVVAEIEAVGGRATFDYQFITKKELDFETDLDNSDDWIEVVDFNESEPKPPSRYRQDEHGRVIERQFETPPGSWLSRRILGEDAFSYIETVSFTFAYHPIQPVDPRFFRDLSRLKVVVLRDSQVNDDWIGRAAKVPELRALALYGDSNSSATAAGLAQLSVASKLESLSMTGEWLDDQTVTGIAGLTQLQFLSVRSGELSSDVFDQLKRLTELRELMVVDAKRIDDRGSENLRRLPNLRVLWLRGTSISDATTIHLAELRQLELLNLDDTNLADPGVERLATLAQLKWLNLARTGVTDQGVKSLANLPQVAHLELSGTGITDASMPDVARMTNLKLLRLYPTSVTDNGMMQLQSLTKLKHLTIGPQVTDEAASALSQSLPRCMLSAVNDNVISPAADCSD
jgi:hypothetical protein